MAWPDPLNCGSEAAGLLPSLEAGRPLRPWLPWIGLGFALGCLGPALPAWLPAWVAWWCLGLPLACLALLVRDTRWPWARRWLVLAASAAAGVWAVGDGFDARPVPATPAEIDGTVRFAKGGRYSQSVMLAGATLAGRRLPQDALYCRAPVLPALAPGDEVRCRGLLAPEEYRGTVALSLRAVDLEVLGYREASARGRAWRTLDRLGGNSELASALLIGVGRPAQHRAFRDSGLLHILAVSGSHLAIVLALSALFVGVLPMPWAWRQILLAGLALGYLWLTGASVPTQRSAAMVMALVAGGLLGRKVHVLSSLALAMLVLLVLDPGQARSIGFQLSAMAVAGIATLGIGLMRVRRELLPFRPWPLDRPGWRALLWCGRWGLDGLAAGLAASLAVAPLIAWHFQAFNPWGAIATLIVTPLVTVILLIGLPLALLADFLPVSFGAGPLEILRWLLAGLDQTVAWTASWPRAMMSVAAPRPVLLLAWPLLFLPLRDRWDLILRAVAAGLALWALICA